MPSTYTPLRYPGGKTKLYDEIKLLIELTGKNGTYIEPFAGGAGLALKLLFRGDVQNVVLNDKDSNVFLFWKNCIEHTDDFCNMIENAKLSIEEWDNQREILKSSSFSDIERAFAFFYLNRCNRSGIIKGGPIGGRDQKGSYKIDARFNKKGLINKIKTIGTKRDQISLFCMDGKEFLQNVCSNYSCDSTFVNIDPPYVCKGPELYQNSFTREDHIELCGAIKELEHNWVVTYDVDEMIKELYSAYTIKEIGLGYSAGSKRKTGHEYLITNIVKGEKSVSKYKNKQF